MKKFPEIDRSSLGLTGFVFAALLFLSLNLIAAFAFSNYRADLTENKLYSLSQGTKDAIAQIREPLTIRFYMSGQLAKVSEDHASYAVRVLELLEQYAAAAGGKIILQVIDPEPFSKKEDEALSYGLKGIPLGNSSEFVYMGLTITNSADRKRVIALLDPARESFLEYDISKYIADLTRSKRPTVGVISTLPIDGQGHPNQMYPKYLPRWTITKLIRDVFDVHFISRQTLEISKDIDVLMLVNPKRFPEETFYAIDQFVMRGGRLLILIDPMSETEVAMGDAPYSVTPDLSTLFERWGIAFEGNRFVGDAMLARPVSQNKDGQNLQIPFPAWIGITKNYLNPEDPVTGSLSSVNLAYAGDFTLAKKIPDIEVTPLIRTSPESALFPSEMGLEPDPAGMYRSFKSDGKARTVAVRVRGKPVSAFKETPKSYFLKRDPHIAKAVKTTNIILIGDADFLSDKYWTTKDKVLDEVRLHPFAGNADLVINALDNLSDSASLITLRSKAEWQRPLTVIEDLAKQSGKTYREEEGRLRMELTAAREQLKALTEAAEKETAEIVARKEMEKIRELQNRIVRIRSELRAVQTILSRDVLALERKLMLMNVFLVPSVLVVIALLVSWRRRIRRLSSVKKGKKA